GLIPAAFGGTSMAQWQKDYKGDFRWPDGRTLFQLATESATAAANEGALAGILWNQGGADIRRTQRDGGAEYRAQLDRLIADFRAALDRPALPFVAATISPWKRPDTKELSQVYLDLPARVPHTAVVDTLAPEFDGKLRNKPNDPAHYDSESARLLGAAYARAMLPLLK
ncbi:MAG: sialate O-acetylesterase, partial [Opitutaceae bacterium]|nr:sialate O-acetylesterase [Opitutaceae bacterium]